jgi:hypothetical protein
MLKKIINHTALLTTVLFSGNSLAENAPIKLENESWQIQVTPYLWATSLSGTAGVTAPPISTDIEISQSDIFDNLDMAFLLNARATKGAWGGAIDMVYMDVSMEKNREPLMVNLEMKQTVVSGSVLYQVQAAEGLELHLGARYVDLANDIKISLNGTERSGIQMSPGDDWVEAFLGARYNYVATPSLNFTAYGDIGGFSGQSDNMYQLVLTANYQINKNISVTGGYRIFDVDYEANNFIYDVTTDGVVLGLGISF